MKFQFTDTLTTINDSYKIQEIHDSLALTLAKNDLALHRLLIQTGQEDQIKIKVDIPYEKIKVTYGQIKAAKAFTGHPGGGYNQDKYPQDDGANRKLAYDILTDQDTFTMEANKTYQVWIKFESREDVDPGSYKGNIQVTSKDKTFDLDIQIQVEDRLIQDGAFDFEFWHHPYSVAEYYGLEPFSKVHIEKLIPILDLYKTYGGRAITATLIDDAWDRQTYSKNPIHYPSMIKWERLEDGTFKWTYDHFDKWIDLCISRGLGSKIKIFGLVPWHDSFRYEEDGRYVEIAFDTPDYEKIWTHFLKDLGDHLIAKNLFDRAYLGIDERGFSEKIVDLIKSVEIQGKTFKISAAIDNIVDTFEIVKDFDDLTVGDNIPHKHKDQFKDLISYRRENGLKTTLYSCTGHRPGNFALSSPAESIWSVLYAYKMGCQGFLRWAFEAWVENPLEDVTHSSFEAGDCFLIYPGPYTSLRLENMNLARKMINKLEQVSPYRVKDLLDNLKLTYEEDGFYLSKAGKSDLETDIRTLKNSLLEE